jgi:hypothetical protein
LGDRCYFSVYVRAVDAQSEEGRAVLGNYGFETPQEDGPVWVFCDASMNYGGTEFLAEWVQTGFPCTGHQEGGSQYGPSNFCTWEGVLSEALTGSETGFVIGFSSDGEPDESDVSMVRDFLRTDKMVDEEMRKGPLELLADCGEPE